MVLIMRLYGNGRTLTIDLDKGVDAERFDALLSHGNGVKQEDTAIDVGSVVFSKSQPNYDSKSKISLGFYHGHTKPLKYIRSAKYVFECLKS